MGAATALVTGCGLIAGTSSYAVDPSLDDASTGGREAGGSGDASGLDSLASDGPADAVDVSMAETSRDTSADVAVDIGTDAAVDTGADVTVDARVDAADASETGVDASTFTALTDPGVWATYDVSHVTGDATDSFNGGAFDGTYMYFAPSGAQVLRLDTTMTGDFTDSTAWTSQTMTAVSEDGGTTTPRGFSGAVYDGKRYVFFVPGQAASAQTSQVVRYDTTAAFSSTSSWEAFDTKIHFGGKAAGFQGAVFDDRYVYFVPNGDGTSGTVVRYDTTNGDFQDLAAWSSVDLSGLSSVESTGFAGGLYVAPYVYFVPLDSSDVARFDTTTALGAASSWTTYDVSQGGMLPSGGFLGGAVVGQEIFLAPNFDVLNGDSFGKVFEYSTSAPFEATASWSSFDTAQLPSSPQGFFGAAYDGRWVYFAPQLSEASGKPAFSGVLARVDTTATFDLPGSWQSFDIGKVDPSAVGFGGAVFDGTYVYFIPGTNTTFARFLARTVAATPPFASSFY